jgi:hypothetical protein
VRDLRVIHNLDAEECLTNMIALELQEELDEQIITDIRTILDSEPTEDITLVGGGRNLWLSEEEMADLQAWGVFGAPEPKPREKVNWMKEGF